MNIDVSLIITVSKYIGAISVILGAVTGILNKLLNSKLDPIVNKIDNNEKDRLRYEILTFANSLRNGNKHTGQEFEIIFYFYDKYEEIINQLKLKNGYLEEEMKFIKKSYEKRKLVLQNKLGES